jgi:hypothetical protein
MWCRRFFLLVLSTSFLWQSLGIGLVMAAHSSIFINLNPPASGRTGSILASTASLPSTFDYQPKFTLAMAERLNFLTTMSAITVTKVANPTTIPEPGGIVNFTITVSKDYTGAATVESLTDSEFGSLNGKGTCLLPTTLPADSGAYACSFPGLITGNAGDIHTNIITAVVSHGASGTVNDTATASVSLTDVPSSIDLTAIANPASVPKPGGVVAFTIQVENTSGADAVTILSLTDNVLGNLNSQGNCQLGQTLAANATYECTYSAQVSGIESETQTRTITVGAIDDDGRSLTKTATVAILVGARPISFTYLPLIYKPALTELFVFNDNTGGNVTFSVLGTGVKCTVPNNATLLCGTFLPGTHTVQAATTSCGVGTSLKTYSSGVQTTRVFCK